MKQNKLPANKSKKYEEELYLKQQLHKDKERKENVASLYKERTLPKKGIRGR